MHIDFGQPQWQRSTYNDRVSFAVVAKAPMRRIREWGEGRGWKNLRLLSSGNNSYNKDYFAERDEGGQIPAINVFQRSKGRSSIFITRNSSMCLRKRDKIHDMSTLSGRYGISST